MIGCLPFQHTCYVCDDSFIWFRWRIFVVTNYFFFHFNICNTKGKWYFITYGWFLSIALSFYHFFLCDSFIETCACSIFTSWISHSVYGSLISDTRFIMDFISFHYVWFIHSPSPSDKTYIKYIIYKDRCQMIRMTTINLDSANVKHECHTNEKRREKKIITKYATEILLNFCQMQ